MILVVWTFKISDLLLAGMTFVGSGSVILVFCKYVCTEKIPTQKWVAGAFVLDAAYSREVY